jgi:hypothetical protein
LDQLLLFSSISAVWGQQGLAHYSGANYFLDAAAHVLHASGRSALSVDFGLFGSVGMGGADAGDANQT